MHYLCCGGESIFGYGSKNRETPVTLCSACEVLISINVLVYRHLVPSSGSSLKKQLLNGVTIEARIAVLILLFIIV